MKQFFEEYGGVIMVLIVVAVLVIIVGTDANSGIAKSVKDALTSAVTQFSTLFSDTVPK